MGAGAPKEAAVMDDDLPVFIPVGANPNRVFGLEAEERAGRLAENAGF